MRRLAAASYRKDVTDLHNGARPHLSSPDEHDRVHGDAELSAQVGGNEEVGSRASRVGGATVFARTLVLIYAAAIAVAVLIPNPHAVGTLKYDVGVLLHRLAARISRTDPTQLGDVVTNVATFVPLTLLFGIAWRRVPAWVWGITGTVVSVCAEATQYLVPELTRRPDIWNVVENSVGAWLGALIAAALPSHRGPAPADRGDHRG